MTCEIFFKFDKTNVVKIAFDFVKNRVCKNLKKKFSKHSNNGTSFVGLFDTIPTVQNLRKMES